ncbi:hypothetical protein QOZ88_16785 [Blastococcus sp. BMG 814]|uniref:Uncharacterized protein n=1 Tax=Blastococcus carthaginiensis TaxID=3050034 RepID=A0ABT9IFD6_9ACTN|nr:hypothetical protein [Blastococcus carthaginiensis]MDP5184292.1 hypothetical protein [Blastococcus carthaginiensis]
MPQPLPPETGPSAPPQQGDPGWPPPTAGWPGQGAQPAPDWAGGTSWQPAAPPPVPAPAAPVPRGRWVLAGAALGGLVVGTAVTALLLGVAVVGGAEDIGRAVAAELGPALTDGIREGMVEGTQAQMEDAMDAYGEEGGAGWYGGAPGGAVEQFPPVEPADLGPDETLDAYADNCFGGELQACDDLMYESPPLSAYEEYASTCGGRVKAYAVMACTELG